MSASTTYPRIYVASLADYNAGLLHGVWIDAAQDADDIHAEVAAMLRDSKNPNVMVDCPECDGSGCDECNHTGKVPSAEEWAIHDYEGFEGIKLSEHESLETISALANAIEEHGVAFAAWWGNESRDDVDVDAFQDAYAGEWDSLADYVQDYWEQCGEFNSHEVSNGNWWHPANYIDWEKMASDLQLSGDIWTHEQDGKVYVFRNC